MEERVPPPGAEAAKGKNAGSAKSDLLRSIHHRIIPSLPLRGNPLKKQDRLAGLGRL